MKLDTVFADLADLAATYRKMAMSFAGCRRRWPTRFATRHLRMLLPHELGGAALDPLDYLQLVEDLASIDGSTARTLEIGIGSALFVGYLAPGRGRAMCAERACGIAGGY